MFSVIDLTWNDLNKYHLNIFFHILRCKTGPARSFTFLLNHEKKKKKGNKKIIGCNTYGHDADDSGLDLSL